MPYKHIQLKCMMELYMNRNNMYEKFFHEFTKFGMPLKKSVTRYKKTNIFQ